MSYAIQEIEINGTTDIRGLMNVRPDMRWKRSAENSSGTLHPTAIHYIRSAPVITGTTRDLQNIATLTNANGDAPMVKVTAIKVTWGEIDPDAPSWETGETHPQHTFNTDCVGYLFVDAIRYQGEVAEVDFSIFLLSDDGETAPLQRNDASLPTLATFSAAYGLYTLTVGGTTISYFDSYSVMINHKAGNDVEGECYSGSKPYPLAMSLPPSSGPVEVTAEIVTNMIVTAPSNGDVVATFKLKESGAADHGDDTVVVTINGEIDPIILPEGNRRATQTYRVFGFYDGTNKPITITA